MLLSLGGRAEAQPAFSLYAWEPIQSARILPDSPLPDELDSRIDLRVTPGEVEPASFVIHSSRRLTGVSIEVSPLEHHSKETGLEPGVVDVRVVKVWYQAGDHFRMKTGTRTFVPELLLKDSSLVRVERETGRQWVRIKTPRGTNYQPIHSAESAFPPDAEIHDSLVLRRFSMAPNRSQQIWLTFRIPADARTGDYSGFIEVKTADGSTDRISVELEVLPFTLEKARIESSLYYRGRLSNEEAEPRGWNVKLPPAYAWDMRNLIDHGVPNPTFTHYGSLAPHVLLDEELALRRAAGMPRGPVYVDGLSLGKPSRPAEFASLRRKVSHWLEWFSDRDYGPVYFYGVDEARNAEIERQLEGWMLARKLGARVMVACYVGASEVAAEFLDMPILAYDLDPKEAARFQSFGQRVYSYANPQVGIEDPFIYRRNYGFLLWRAGYDGSMTYAFQDGLGNIWNDFDTPEGKKIRDHVFAYPTDSGVIDTVQWEGFREATDDLRYLATLQARIEQMPKGRARRDELLWLEGLDIDLDPRILRSMMIEKIIELGN